VREIVLLPPAKLRSYLPEKRLEGTPLIRVKKWRDGYVFANYPPRQVSPFLNQWKLLVGTYIQEASKLTLAELYELAVQKLGVKPLIVVRTSLDGRPLTEVTFTDPHLAEEYIDKMESSGATCSVFFKIGSRLYPRTALALMLLRGTRISPWFIFPNYRPPLWFVQTCFSRGLKDALFLYGLYIGGYAPEKIRKIVFERLLDYLKTQPQYRQLAERLSFIYNFVLERKKAPPQMWVPALIRTFLKLAQERGLFKTVQANWTPQDDYALFKALETAPKGHLTPVEKTLLETYLQETYRTYTPPTTTTSTTPKATSTVQTVEKKTIVPLYSLATFRPLTLTKALQLLNK